MASSNIDQLIDLFRQQCTSDGIMPDPVRKVLRSMLIAYAQNPDPGASVDAPIEPQVTLDVPKPPADVFVRDSSQGTAEQRQQDSEPLFILDRVEYPEEGGILVYLQGHPFPRKGFPTFEAVTACSLAKRMFIGQMNLFAGKETIVGALGFLFIPRSWKIKVLERWLESFTRLAKVSINQYILKPERYTPICQELRTLISTFLLELGVSFHPAMAFAVVFSTLIEYDSAYRYRMEDIFSETTKEKLLESPRKEIVRLFDIYSQRETRKHLTAKFKAVVSVLTTILWLPFVRKAFCKAVEKTNIPRLGLDEAERYHVLWFADYNFFGVPFEARQQTYLKIHGGKPPQAVNYTAAR